MRMFFLIFFENLFFCKKLFNSSGDDFGICAPPIDEPTTMVHSAILSRGCVCLLPHQQRSTSGGAKSNPTVVAAGRQAAPNRVLAGGRRPPPTTAMPVGAVSENL